MAKLRPCITKKRIFPTDLDAKIMLMKLRKRDKGQVRHYFCPHCKHYHLTSQPKESTNA